MILMPNVAGTFYPASKEQLLDLLRTLHRKVELEYITSLTHQIGEVKAIIAPHAGYIFSGIVAMYTYTLLSKKLNVLKKVYLWGPSHYYTFPGCAQPKTFTKWRTPLGEVDIQKYKNKNILEMDSLFTKEHSLEVHLPFLQYFFSSFVVYPLLFGDYSCFDNFNLKDGEVIVVSSDLSHYLPYEEAVKRDKETLTYIKQKDLSGFNHKGDACGKYAISCLLFLARKNKWKVEIIKYMNSGDISGDKERVVGYGGVVFYE